MQRLSSIYQRGVAAVCEVVAIKCLFFTVYCFKPSSAQVLRMSRHVRAALRTVGR